MSREPFTEWTKNIVTARYENKCFDCGTTFGIPYDRSRHMGHIVPDSAGGPPLSWNLVLICGDCNRQQHAKVYSSQIEEMADNLGGYASKGYRVVFCHLIFKHNYGTGKGENRRDMWDKYPFLRPITKNYKPLPKRKLKEWYDRTYPEGTTPHDIRNADRMVW